MVMLAVDDLAAALQVLLGDRLPGDGIALLRVQARSTCPGQFKSTLLAVDDIVASPELKSASGFQVLL